MEIRNICNSLGIRLIAYSPLGLGMLTGKYSSSKLPLGPRYMDYQVFTFIFNKRRRQVKYDIFHWLSTLSRNICCLLFFRALLFRQILPGLEPLLSSLREIAQKRNKTLPQVLLCTSFFHCYLLKNWWEIWEININNYSARVSCLIELSYLELKVSLDEKVCKMDTLS